MSSSPVRSQPQSMPSRSMVLLDLVERLHAEPQELSSPRRRTPRRRVATPCVSEPTQMPPLRPLAWPATSPASRTTTSAPGSRSLASSAAQRPVKPAPTTARSQVSAPASAGRGGAAAAGRARTERAWRRRPPAGRGATAVTSVSERRACMMTTLPGGEDSARRGVSDARRRGADRSGRVGRDGRPDRAAGPAARPAPRLVDVVPRPHGPSLGARRTRRQPPHAALTNSEQVFLLHAAED